MQDAPLSVHALFRHGASLHRDSEIVTNTGCGIRRSSFPQVADRIDRLAATLRRLGVRPGDRVGSFCWNQQEHLELYFAVPLLNAILHTINIRLFPDQLAYTINHAEDRIVVVDETLAPVLAGVLPQCPTVKTVIVIGASAELAGAISYGDLLAAEATTLDWPEPNDEHAAAMICYTSGTTGDPKGVVYSHRSIYLHSLAECAAGSLGICDTDRVLVCGSMFHANGWGFPFTSWLAGADLLLPGRYLQAEPLCNFIVAERPTFAGGVPTIWNEVARFAETKGFDLSCFRLIICGGSAVPPALIERFRQLWGVKLVQIWGMTETSPLAALGHPPKGDAADQRWRTKTARAVSGVEIRVTNGDHAVPCDGKSVGEIEVRGPWVTASYFKDPSLERFHDGWLRTGDVGTIDEIGYIQISDRAKDVIKSGGEWISSVELEKHLMAHPDVVEAAVIGVPDSRWDERPLACIVLREGSPLTPTTSENSSRPAWHDGGCRSDGGSSRKFRRRVSEGSTKSCCEHKFETSRNLAMAHIEKVIFPVDFSKRSEGAAHYVEAIAAKFNPEIRMVHVLPPPHYEAMSLEVTGPALNDLIASRETLARKQLNSFLAAELRPFRVTRELLDGDPAKEIVELAHREGAGLIVLPTHGYGVFRRFILGSVSAKVLHDAECPVLTGVHMEDAPAMEKIFFRRILAAVDMEPHTAAVLKWAAAMATAYQAKLVITHVAPSIEGKAGERFDPDWRESFIKPVRERLQKLMDDLSIQATVVFDWGEPSKQVCEVASAEKADLLVIGRGQHSSALGRLRTHSYAIIRMAPCPVVSV